MYGSYRINEEKEGAKPRLSLVFKSGVVNFYYCSVRIIGNEEVDELYDEELDITSEKWNIDKVLRLASKMKGELICDVLLDQDVFAGVGNIIKNEALFMARIHPLSIVEKIPEEKLKEVTLKAREFSMLFYEVRKRGKRLNPYYKIYRKKLCSPCNEKVVMKRTGKRERISYFCPSCQYLYT
jgi:endonuclease-8